MTEPEIDRNFIREEFERERGYWRPWNDILLRERPSFLQKYARYAGHPSSTGPLSARMVELIYVGLDASSSHLFESGLTIHMKKALEAGASRQAIFDVLQLVTTQGMECTLQGIGILAEETGEPRGSDDAWAWLAQHDPGYAEVARLLLEDRATTQGLTDDERCLVQIALHACFTAFNPMALRQAIRQGLNTGLTREQMLQAIQLGSHLSVHGTALGARVFETLN